LIKNKILSIYNCHEKTHIMTTKLTMVHSITIFKFTKNRVVQLDSVRLNVLRIKIYWVTFALWIFSLSDTLESRLKRCAYLPIDSLTKNKRTWCNRSCLILLAVNTIPTNLTHTSIITWVIMTLMSSIYS